MHIVHPLAGSPIGQGASAGVVAQQSGIMPVAVTLFTVLRLLLKRAPPSYGLDPRTCVVAVEGE